MLSIRNICNGDKGFTMIELLIGLALFSILSLGLWSILDHATRNSERTQLQIETVENARVALDFMVEEIRRAENIKIKYPEGPLSLDIDGDGDYIIGSSSPDVEFEFDRAKGQIKYNSIVLVDDIEELGFSPDDFDSNLDGVYDKNLIIHIKTKKPANILGTDILYDIKGEVSVKYKSNILVTY
ncbi:MAG: prepilin-type N-terminal cleavage/methylation domain-containing protein [Epulopiscium sp.]|nr:prepilin-type N-terminal cleavage/methylation domain-containing protein [Candidatus Epulonipiscium sp.]